METLASLVQRDGPLNELDAVGWVIRLAKHVEELHRVGVAHGGISAEAVRVAGSSHASAGLLVEVRLAASVPSYHSPERNVGGPISVEDDVWAMAVTLYFLLTGSLPFPGTTAIEVGQRLAGSQPAPLAVFDVGDDDLQRVLDDLFVKNATARIAKVAALRDALERWHSDPRAREFPPLEASATRLGGPATPGVPRSSANPSAPSSRGLPRPAAGLVPLAPLAPTSRPRLASGPAPLPPPRPRLASGAALPPAPSSPRLASGAALPPAPSSPRLASGAALPPAPLSPRLASGAALPPAPLSPRLASGAAPAFVPVSAPAPASQDDADAEDDQAATMMRDLGDMQADLARAAEARGISLDLVTASAKKPIATSPAPARAAPAAGPALARTDPMVAMPRLASGSVPTAGAAAPAPGAYPTPPPAAPPAAAFDDDDTNASTVMINASELDLSGAFSEAFAATLASAAPAVARVAEASGGSAVPASSSRREPAAAAVALYSGFAGQPRDVPDAAPHHAGSTFGSGSGDSSVDRVLGGNYAMLRREPTVPVAPNRPVDPAVERTLAASRGAISSDDEGRGLRIALFVGIALLVAVVSGVLVLYLRQRGVLTF